MDRMGALGEGVGGGSCSVPLLAINNLTFGIGVIVKESP